MRTLGESVVYYPDGGITGRTITALVERGTFEVIGEVGEQAAPAIIVRVKADATEGITADEVDPGIDEISIGIRSDGTPERRSIVRVMSDTGGMLRLWVQ